MTDEEKAEELVKENVCKKCGSKVCGFLIRKCDIALPRYEGVLVGLAEGRKEECFEQNNDGTIRPCEVMKENEELKAQIEKLECCKAEIQVKALDKFLQNLKMISPDVYKKYCETDFVELRRCQNRLNQSKG